MTNYDELLSEARTKLEVFHASTAKVYVPRMYYALREEKLSPEDARDKIEKDCVGIWSKRTLLDALPDEAKDLKKQKAGRLRQKELSCAANSAAQSSEENKKKVTIDTQGRTIENEIPPSTSLPYMSFTSNRNNEERCTPNNDHNKLENLDHLLQFEFALGSNEIFNHIFFSSDKDIWFSGTLDKITGKVITASIGRMSQYTPNVSGKGDGS